MLNRTVVVASALLLIGSATPSLAQTPTVSDLIKDGYEIESSFPIEGGYGVLLEKDATVMLCSINFEAASSTFVTTKCYTVK